MQLLELDDPRWSRYRGGYNRAVPDIVPFLLYLVFLAIGASAQADEFITLQSDTDRLLDHLHERGDFSGAVIIGGDDLVVYEGAFGMADQTRPFTLDSVADGASLAKTVTAAVIWRLIGNGVVALDDPILRVDQGPTYKMFPVGFGILYVPGKDAYVGIETSNDSSSPRLTWSSVFINSKGLRLQR